VPPFVAVKVIGPAAYASVFAVTDHWFNETETASGAADACTPGAAAWAEGADDAPEFEHADKNNANAGMMTIDARCFMASPFIE
jgi:hypothetical protein